MPRESAYQRDLVGRLEAMFPGCIVLKNDPRQIQGIPDILILFGNQWGMLEIKRSANENVQPNQVYYVDQFGAMSFAAFIWPENEEEVLIELQQAFGIGREARAS